MEIERDILSALLNWKQRPGRKPLIIQGARQIGKTWIMKKFGEEYYDHVAYFNFDASEELCREFLRADTPQMYEYLENMEEVVPLPEIAMGRIGEAYRRYQVCGGNACLCYRHA